MLHRRYRRGRPSAAAACVHEAFRRQYSGMASRKAAWLAAVSAALAIMFAVFSYLQLNDTDPAIYDRPSVLDAWSWAVFYGLIAVLFLVSIFRSVPRSFLFIAALFCLWEMARTVPGLYENLFKTESFKMAGAAMAASHPEVERTREFFGALIALAGVGFLQWQARQRDRAGA